MFTVLVLASFALFTCVFVVLALFGCLRLKNIPKRKKVRASVIAKEIAYSCFTASHPIWRPSVGVVMIDPTVRQMEFSANGSAFQQKSPFSKIGNIDVFPDFNH